MLAMADSKTITNNPTDIPICEIAELLQDVPLHSPRRILSFSTFPDEIYVYCDQDKCDFVCKHQKVKSDSFRYIFEPYCFVVYCCSNCPTSITQKIFILRAELKSEENPYTTFSKIYQKPGFGQPIPKRLFHIIGETNREHFLQARRAIARGLGIGAHSYYRRIVENTKFDLVGSVLEVAKATNASTPQIELLKKAQAERQFSKAMEMLQDVNAIPAVLLIKGQNPLSLLHDLLSEGIHQFNDRECLERSQDAEIILCEIAKRIQIALTEQKTVNAALASIMNRKLAGEKNAATS
jgi:hypothetical protein